MYSGGTTKSSKLEYYQVVEYFDTGKVTKYELNIGTGKLSFTLDDGTTKKYTVPDVNLFVNDIHDGVVEYNRENPDKAIKFDYVSGASYSFWLQLIPIGFGLVLLVVGGYILMKRMNNTISSENNRAMNFGKARVKFGKDEKRKTTFKEVAGADEEKDELQEIVEFLKDPKKFTELGARIPNGVLLVGPPGTGKTLLARAVAGEADVPFFSISGSDFVEMYVGVGASRVRDLFDQAKKSSPAIIFIDEIDAVGRHRGAGMGGGHDEREQTLNQLLVEMDGFGNNEGIIIIAATNRPDILDPALLRPGRFDRQVTVGRPDLKGREEILKVHAKNKPLAPDVDLKTVAHGTVGFVGADLENLLNEAALLAARRGKKAITMAEVEEATIKVVAGPEKRSRKVNEKDKRLTSYHEAGHAIAGHLLPTQDDIHHITIIPRGRALGMTISLPEKDKFSKYKKEMEEEIVMLLAGRIAEQIYHGDNFSTGASNDIERATKLARAMITQYGMSDKFGMMCLATVENQYLGGGAGLICGEKTASQIDEEVLSIITERYNEAYKMLEENREILDRISEYLCEKETITGKEFMKVYCEMKGLPYEEKAANALQTGKSEVQGIEAEDNKQEENNDHMFEE